MNHSPAEAAEPPEEPRRRNLRQTYPLDYEGVGDPSLPLQNSCLVWMRQVNEVDTLFKQQVDRLRVLASVKSAGSSRRQMVEVRSLMREMKLAVEEKKARNESFIECVNTITNISAMAAAAEAAEKAASSSAPVATKKRLHNKLAELRRLKAEKRAAREREKQIEVKPETPDINEAVAVEVVQRGSDIEVKVVCPSVTPSPPAVSETSNGSSDSTEKSDTTATSKRSRVSDEQESEPSSKRIKVDVSSAEPEVAVSNIVSPKSKEAEEPVIAETPTPVVVPEPSPPKEEEKPTTEEFVEPPTPAPTPQEAIESELQCHETLEPSTDTSMEQAEHPKTPDVTEASPEPEQSLPETAEPPPTPEQTFETSEEMPITREPTPEPKEETPEPAKAPEPKPLPKKKEKPAPKKLAKKMKKTVKQLPKRVTRQSKKAAIVAKPIRKISTRKRIATRKSLDKPVLTPAEIAAKKAERARLKEQRQAQRRQEEADAAEVAMVAAQLEAEGEIPSRRAAATAAAAAIHHVQSPRSSFAISNPLAAFAITSPRPSTSGESSRGASSTRGKRGGRGRGGRGGRGGSFLTRANLARAASTVSSRGRSRRSTATEPPAPVVVDTNLYCSCQTISYGKMIACEGVNCPYQWFHFGCVNVTEAPDTDWYCPDCAPARRKPSTRGSRGRGISKRGKRGRKAGAV